MNETIACTFIGHCTTLLKMGETTLLTDPHFGSRTILSPRHGELPIAPRELPKPTAVVLSHLHRDHFHISSLKFLSCRTPIIVPEGCERIVGKYMPNPVVELSPWAEYRLSDGTRITAVPVEHRSLLSTRGETGAWHIRRPDDGGAVFFCGDAAYGPHFAEAASLGHIDLALLPIGGYEPRAWMRRAHMTPAEAVQAFEDIQAGHLVPIHHGTFRLSLEGIDAPRKWMERILEERPDLRTRIHLLAPGESYELSAHRAAAVA